MCGCAVSDVRISWFDFWKAAGACLPSLGDGSGRELYISEVGGVLIVPVRLLSPTLVLEILEKLKSKSVYLSYLSGWARLYILKLSPEGLLLHSFRVFGVLSWLF